MRISSNQLNSESLKIISLVPSQSELLWDLGIREELIGITKFCIHPDEMFRSVTRIGGTKNLNIDLIRELKPDLIIANEEENEKSQIEILQKEFNVHVTEIYTLDDSYKMIESIGKMVGKKARALELIAEIQTAFFSLSKPLRPKKVLYLIWNDPFMAAGKNTIIDDLLMHAGFENCLHMGRYPVLSLKEIEALEPELIFLSSEPFPFSEKHFELFKSLAKAKPMIVDGEMFSWYGSRVKSAPAYFKTLREAIEQPQYR